MAEKNWNEALDALNEKLDALGERVKETADIAKWKALLAAKDVEGDIVAVEVRAEDAADREKQAVSGAALAAKANFEEIIKSTKGDLIAAQERCREIAERSEDRLSAELLKAQINFEGIEEKLHETKEKLDKKHMESYIEKQIDHAAHCYAHASVLIEDARLATLEAILAAAEYENALGEEE